MVDVKPAADGAAAPNTANATEEENKAQAEPEQSPNLEETFEEPVLEELKLKNSWTLWEHYESQGDRRMDYASQMCKACWFNDLISFAVAWNTLPHRDLTNIFFNEQSKTVKM